MGRCGQVQSACCHTFKGIGIRERVGAIQLALSPQAREKWGSVGGGIDGELETK